MNIFKWVTVKLLWILVDRCMTWEACHYPFRQREIIEAYLPCLILTRMVWAPLSILNKPHSSCCHCPVTDQDAVSISGIQLKHLIILLKQVGVLKPCSAKSISGNIKTYLHFLSFLNIEMLQVLEILPHGRQGLVYLAYPIPCIAVIRRSIFSKIITKDTPYIALMGELWVVFCGFKRTFIFCPSYRSDVYNIMLYWTAL